MSILSQTAWTTSRVIAQNGGALSRAIYKIANIYVKSYNNLNYDMTTNGEHHLLDRLARIGVKTVFDVGANKGDYTLACLSRFEDVTIHAFEIAPPTYQKLVRNVSSDRVKFNQFGLSDTDGSFTLNYSVDDDGLSSIVEGIRIHDGNWRSLPVDVVRGDRYCRENGVGSIDLLKVDVEGAEHLVLDGFSETFEGARISAVQFEFGMVNVYSKFLLKDFYEFFGKHDFVLGPIMPRGVDFKAYHTRDEDFQGPPNFLAVHRSRPEIIEAVRR